LVGEGPLGEANDLQSNALRTFPLSRLTGRGYRKRSKASLPLRTVVGHGFARPLTVKTLSSVGWRRGTKGEEARGKGRAGSPNSY
jgi:hypothetical protein